MTGWLQRWALYLLAGALLVSLAGHAAQLLHGRGLEVRIAAAEAATATERAGRQEDRATWATASAQAEAGERETERLRRMARDKVIDDAHTTIARQAGAAADLRSVVAGLRDDLDAATVADRASGAPSGDTTAAAGGAAAAGAGLVRPELRGGALGEVAGLAADLAIAFDDARARGLSCELSYESLMTNPVPVARLAVP